MEPGKNCDDFFLSIILQFFSLLQLIVIEVGMEGKLMKLKRDWEAVLDPLEPMLCSFFNTE